MLASNFVTECLVQLLIFLDQYFIIISGVNGMENSALIRCAIVHRMTLRLLQHFIESFRQMVSLSKRLSLCLTQLCQIGHLVEISLFSEAKTYHGHHLGDCLYHVAHQIYEPVHMIFGTYRICVN